MNCQKVIIIRSLLALLLLMLCIDLTAQTYQKIPYGIKATIDSISIKVQFYSNDIVRIIKFPEEKTFDKTSFAVVKKPEKVGFMVNESGNVLHILGNSVKVDLNLQDGQVIFSDQSGKLLLSEKKQGTQFSPCKDTLEDALEVKQSFLLNPGEAIYGLGQHQSGEINKRGEHILLRQRNMQIAIPYFYSTNGYGLFWDNTSTTVFRDSTNETSFESEVGNGVDYYFLRSDNMTRSLKEWRLLTGQAPMLPKWAYGYWQSRERYKSQEELLNVVKKYRELKVPLDVIVQDWQYWGKDNDDWNSTEFGSPGYPRPKDMIDSVHSMHAHMAISVWPDFGKNTAIYKELKEHGYLYNKMISYPPAKDIKVYDAFNPKAHDIYWDYMNRNLFDLGIDAWWLDSSEPDQAKPDENDDIKTYHGLFGKVRNAFPISTVGGVYNHQRQETSKKRVTILTRSAYAGQQRYGAINWSGDVQSSWKSLSVQIANGLSMSVCGIPYWNSDIGGFFSAGHYPNGVSDPAYRELYVRWLEFGAFCPIMRSHGTQTPREIYQFGEKGNWSYDAIAKFIKLRYRLLPYIYSLAWGVTSRSGTFMQPLGMDFPRDTATRNISNEYLFGSAFLVAPVTKPFYTSKTKDQTKVNFSEVQNWPVYLPKGADWYNFWTGKKVVGGKKLYCKAPIDEIPLYVKSGSIIPMGPVMQWATQKPDSVLEIRVYPGANGSFTLYEDENDNYDYERGMYSTIHFEWNDKNKRLTIARRKGSFPGMLQNRIFRIMVVNETSGVSINEASESRSKTVKYTGKEIEIHF